MLQVRQLAHLPRAINDHCRFGLAHALVGRESLLWFGAVRQALGQYPSVHDRLCAALPQIRRSGVRRIAQQRYAAVVPRWKWPQAVGAPFLPVCAPQ